MAEASGKSGGPTISSIAAPTADIDDEWALDDAEAAASPVATTPSSSALETQEAQKSGSPATEAIDSEWPDDAVSADQLRKPKIPLAPKLPEEAVGLTSQQAAPTPTSAGVPSSPPRPTSSTPAASEPPISEDSIDKFERAASVSSRGAFGLRTSSAPPAPPEAKGAVAASAPPAAEPSRPPPAIELRATSEKAPAPEASATTAPVTRERDVRATSNAPPPASRAPEALESVTPAGKSKKGAALVYGLAAAAVAIAGVGLAMRAPSTPERAIERAQSALEPDPASQVAPSKTQALAEPIAPVAVPGATAPSATAPSASADANLSADEAKAAGEDEAAGKDEAAGENKASKETAAAAEAPTAGTPMLVTVHIYPPETEIYHKGKRLGRSGQAIEVLPGERKLLVLIREGYWPRKLILDGKETTYNIGLRKQPEGTGPRGTTGAAPAPGATPKFTPPTP